MNKNVNQKLVLITLTMFLALVLAGAVSAEELPLTTNGSGTVSGDLYVDVQQPTPFGSQPQNTGVTQEATFDFGSSGYTDIEYAKLYTMVYVAGTDNRECNVDVSMDGNNDGTYETALDSVTLNTASNTNGDVYWQNDHINRVYSDYLLFYDVKDYIQNGIINVKVQTSPGAANMDGRIKYIALAVVYNDGDNDVVAYWVNDGHQWFNDGTFRETTFNTAPLVEGWDSAQLKAVTTSSTDAAYTFNSEIKPSGVPSNYLCVNTWDVTDDIDAGETSTLRYAKDSGSYKTTLSTLKVRYDAPHLEITAVNYNPDNASGHRELFAHEANNIVATIINNGSAAAGPFNVNLDIGGYTETQSVPGLGIGESVNVVFTGYAPSSIGMKDVEVTVDLDDEIVDTFTGQREVFYNGYKGKSYTDGDNLETTNYLEGFIDLIYSPGDSAYRGSGAANWNNPYNVNWTSTDLPIPEGATVVLAKLYQGYTWNTVPGMPDFNAEFNGTPINVVAHYFDQKSYGTSNNPSGLMVYDVTSLFNTSGNTLTLTKGANTLTALYGSYLVVVYEKAGETFKRIWINEEADMLYSRTDYSTNDEEATAYANYTNIPITGMVDAKAIAILASANDDGKSKYYFNGSEYTGFWADYLAGPQIGFSEFDVTGDVQQGNNLAALQSHNPGTNGDNMVAFQNILIMEYIPELVVTSVNYNPTNTAGHRELFANEANNITATIKNNGGTAGAFDVTICIDGYTETKRIDGLAAGESVDVTFTGYTPSSIGMKNVEVKVELDDEIVDTFTGQREVFYNGYKGKSYTDGDDLNTTQVFAGNYDILYSTGNSAYAGAGWTDYNVNWNSTDLNIPEGAIVVLARLYQGYTWDQTPGGMPLWNVTFNGTPVSAIATYTDRKGYGTYNYPSGLFVYDVTSTFNINGNTLNITPQAGNNNALYGSYLVLVYMDPEATNKRIIINDGTDLLYSRTTYSTSDEEATAYANFANVNQENLKNAKVIAIMASANEEDKSKFYFNGSEYTGFWADYLAGPQIGFSEFDVTGDVQAGNNVAAMQSHNPGTNGDNMVALNAIFVAEYQPTASFTGTPTSGVAPLPVQFTSTSIGATSYEWDFGDGQTSTDENPIHTYTDPGTYTVKLTVTGPGGSHTETKQDYITVNHPAPVASFTGTPTTGFAPLPVQFTSTSTGTINTYEWDFGDGNTSTAANPIHTYNVPGTYTVTLKVTGPGGEDTKTEANYITVNHPAPVASFTATPTNGREPLKVQFNNHSTGTINSYEWDFGDGAKSTAANPIHTYNRAGTYTVKLTVTGPGGTRTQTRTQYITVKLPDLVMQSITAPTTARRGRNIRVTNRVRNSGNISTGKGFYVAFYLRSTKTSRRYYIGRRWVGNLGVGSSSSRTNYFRIPRNIPRGRYYVMAVADYTNSIRESSKANNTRYTTGRTRIS
ncbi:MAG: DUF3344 domain-containing protein [Methanobacteriaceae archaeon]|nr:DUF3344 domain-containing protein [Methanobacteriaceae archaeon]